MHDFRLALFAELELDAVILEGVAALLGVGAGIREPNRAVLRAHVAGRAEVDCQMFDRFGRRLTDEDCPLRVPLLRFVFEYNRRPQRVVAGAAGARLLHAQQAVRRNHAVPATGPHTSKQLQAAILLGVHDRAAVRPEKQVVRRGGHDAATVSRADKFPVDGIAGDRVGARLDFAGSKVAPARFDVDRVANNRRATAVVERLAPQQAAALALQHGDPAPRQLALVERPLVVVAVMPEEKQLVVLIRESKLCSTAAGQVLRAVPQFLAGQGIEADHPADITILLGELLLSFRDVTAGVDVGLHGVARRLALGFVDIVLQEKDAVATDHQRDIWD